MQTVETTIDSLRSVVGAKNDAELARQLNIDQSTISSWRARGRIPQRFVKLLETDSVPPIEAWPELHDRGTAVAVARYVLLRQEVAMSGDLDKAVAAFLDLRPFWLVMHRAVDDIRAKMKSLNIELGTAAALVLQEDLRNPKATAARVATSLAEDQKDNPWLKSWK